MQTKGETLIGITPQPFGDVRINEIKRKAADLIDLIEDISVPPVGKPGDQDRTDEIVRQKDMAQAAIKDAVDLAVLAATKPPVADE